MVQVQILVLTPKATWESHAENAKCIEGNVTKDIRYVYITYTSTYQPEQRDWEVQVKEWRARYSSIDVVRTAGDTPSVLPAPPHSRPPWRLGHGNKCVAGGAWGRALVNTAASPPGPPPGSLLCGGRAHGGHWTLDTSGYSIRCQSSVTKGVVTTTTAAAAVTVSLVRKTAVQTEGKRLVCLLTEVCCLSIYLYINLTIYLSI